MFHSGAGNMQCHVCRLKSYWVRMKRQSSSVGVVDLPKMV